MIKVKSSNIKGIEYKDNMLVVYFHNDKIYHYHDVPKTVFDKMKEADSVGKFASANLYGKFAYSMAITEENKPKEKKQKDKIKKKQRTD